jgi:hypothetical protein
MYSIQRKFTGSLTVEAKKIQYIASFNPMASFFHKEVANDTQYKIPNRELY